MYGTTSCFKIIDFFGHNLTIKDIIFVFYGTEEVDRGLQEKCWHRC